MGFKQIYALFQTKEFGVDKFDWNFDLEMFLDVQGNKNVTFEKRKKKQRKKQVSLAEPNF